MSEENNLDPNNLCIPVDAFDQFQASTHLEEEEFITLSDIVSPETVIPQLPNDLAEIPYDNEVVLSNDENQPGSTEVSETDKAGLDGEFDTIEDASGLNSLPENHGSVEQSVEQTPDEDVSGLAARPRRARKQKNYAEDFLPTVNFKREGKTKSVNNQRLVTDTPPTKPKRVRKTKQSLTPKNEPTQPEESLCDSQVEQSPVAPKRGRKRMSNKAKVNIESQTSATVKPSVGRRGRKSKVTPVEGDLPPEEQLNNLPPAEESHELTSKEEFTSMPSADSQQPEEDNVSSELINNSELDSSFANIPKKPLGRRGKKKKNPSDQDAPTEQLPETSELSHSSMTEDKSSKIKKRGGRKKKIQQDYTTANNDSKPPESDDELDNISLHTLSQRTDRVDDNQVSINECKMSSDVDVDGVDHDETGKVQEHLMGECSIEVEVNTEPQDMELDEPVDSSHNLSMESINEDQTIKVEKIENSENIENAVKIENSDINENGDINDSANDSLLVEDSSRRPRRNAKKILKYEEESDEDPFANLELSDDEPSGKRKGKGYQDDDEYRPEIETTKKGGRRGRSITESEDSDISDIVEELEHFGKKRKRGASRTPQKRGRKDTAASQDLPKEDNNLSADINVTTIAPAIDLVDDPDDFENCLQSSVIHASKDKVNGETPSSKPSTNVWANTNAFESFIAQKIQGTNLKIKKVSSNEPSQNTPLEIPVLDPEAKKSAEKEVQTNITKLATIGVQTSSKHETPMKNNVSLLTEQSEQACEFLKSIVKTTSELGQLMTQKSEDFITKKIHTDHVTDTFKMDYCVKKSFLLLKLAKHNIVQMEEDLSKQYEEFLKRTDLICHREEEKTIKATEKDNDSDCEIVEEPSTSQSSKSQKKKFNPKTVFLNKELSIKIAKKPQSTPIEKKCKQLSLNKHSVWINDSVMVKKVKPTQSFLAQDSRNKKPPDCFVTEKMVSDFFEDYYKKAALSICAPFTSSEWLSCSLNYICSYFVVKPDNFAGASSSFPDNVEVCLDGSASNNVTNSMNVSDIKTTTEVHKRKPQSLLELCTEILKKHMGLQENSVNHPCTLFRLCVNALNFECKSFKGCSFSHSNQQKPKIHDQPLYHDSVVPTLSNALNFECKSFAGCKFSHSNQLKPKIHDQPLNHDSVFPTLSIMCIKKIQEMVNFDSKFNDDYKSTLEIYADSNGSSECNLFNEDTNIDDIQHAGVVSLKKLCYNKLSESYFYNDCHKDTTKAENLKFWKESDLVNCEDLSDNSSISSYNISDANVDYFKRIKVPTLLTLCHRKLFQLFSLPEAGLNGVSDNISISFDSLDGLCLENVITELCTLVKIKEVDSLLSLCLRVVQKSLQMKKYYSTQDIVRENSILSDSSLYEKEPEEKYTPDSLKSISLHFIKNTMFRNMRECENIVSEHPKVHKVKKLADICFEMIPTYTSYDSNNADSCEGISVGMTINCVNTVSEDVFHNMEEDEDENDEDTTFYDDDNLGDDYDTLNDENPEDNQTEENNWVSQLRLQVQQDIKSCLTINNQTNNESHDRECSYSHGEDNGEPDSPIQVRIKEEPLEEPIETVVDSTCIKTEPPHHDEMPTVLENVVAKTEPNIEDNVENHVTLPHASFDVNSFENFVRRNKMMNPLDETDEMFDHTGHRVRRQHEPDYMNEYDPSLNLLIPQTYEPISVENAKGVLMESSSDEESKKPGQKKGDKRRGRPRKANMKAQKPQPEKANVKGKPPPTPLPPVVSEVAILTRRMREKIRQEEKKVQSSDSESEHVPLTRKKDKDRKEKDNEKTEKSKNEEPAAAVDKSKEVSNENKKHPKNQKLKPDDEIQCNNVDSTEQIENLNDSPESIPKFTGFSAVDQNEITSYEKYVKFVYDKILPKDTPSPSPTNEKTPGSTNMTEEDPRSESPLIDYDGPAEMLECEPTMPIFDEEHEQKKTKTPKVKIKLGKGKMPILDKKSDIPKDVINKDNDNTPIYTERDGWHIYPINPKETKLYQNAALILDKLPEDFVETYFRYQEISSLRKEDAEVDRLINLNTLNRSAAKEGKKPKLKGKAVGTDSQPGKSLDSSRATSPNFDERAELTASEDEGANVDDEVPPEMPFKHSETLLAKDSLMNDSDSDEALSKIKQEISDDTMNERPKPACKKKKKGAKVEEPILPENLMLTADKMMNKELNLLHAPVVLSSESAQNSKGPSPKKHRSGSKKNSSRDHMKNEEDSSSEEEKQWVTTKEKLLKRLVKKDTATADDAKRAKLVCDFIERREGTECRKRKSGKGRRRNSRKMLEREKQMRVLQHELLGTPLDPALPGTRHGQYAQSVFKGRRNIRKVIDKKSLARSTVIANMEEFERKRRLTQQQARLRELLGCEEGVNVLVINDEVCLQYGFEEQRPLVTVHPFFTKVMKAHQYEGVKFMWDACFESLEQVQSGHPGGGCILAHCMGLGKTLQVLALLHTVLTHPRVGIQRVLVCCPLSTVLNWVDEIHKWIGPVTDQIKVFELSKLKKTYERAYQLEDWYSGGGIFIIGYELFRSLTTLDPELDDVRPTIVNKIRTALLDPGPDIIVCDEGHLLKNDCSVLAVAMSRVATKRRIVLTGTPMQNNLREYYCMVNFIKPNLLGTYSEYSNRFENPIMNGQHRDSREEDIKLMKQRTHILHKVLEGCLQRQEASVLYPYLPKKHEYTVFISLTQVQWVLYKHYLDNYSQKGNKHSILKDFHILQKIWSHPQVLHNFQMRRRDENKIKAEKLEDDLAREDLTATEDVKPLETDEVWWLQYQQNPDGEDMLNCLASSNKFVVVFKILDECIALGDKVLIFSTSLFTMDALEYFLKKINKWSLGQDYYRLDGSVPPEVRQKWCREFNAEHNVKTKLFLISTRAGSLGLNMVAANRVIILDTSWNPAHDIQSIFRVYRFGQKKDCYIYRLVALGTMEQKIYERSVTKQAVACRVVDEQQIDRHYNMAELTELYKYDEEGVSVAGGVAAGVEDVALLRVARLPALHAVHEHDSLLRGSSEQQLPEHERAAAWMQFQEEHAHKQMQNHLTSSFSLHLPLPPGLLPVMPNGMMVNIPSLHMPGPSQPEIKQENTDPEFQPTPEQKKNKGKKKAKEQENTSGQATPEHYNDSTDATYRPEDETKGSRGRKSKQEPLRVPEEVATEENMVEQIVGLLLKNRFLTRQGPKEIAQLVSTVRKMVAYEKPKVNSKLSRSITAFLLSKEGIFITTSQDDPMRKTIQKANKGKRGRPKKNELSAETSDNSAPPTPQPSTSSFAYAANTYPGRRRAAVEAEKHITHPEGDDNNHWQDADDFQTNDSGNEEIVPETRSTKNKPIKREKKAPIAPAKETMESIVLSDDDEPAPKQTKTKEAPAKPEEVVPLHPSLLSNKNFIKIVAHTYLEGNPMLDEDAATLAAQYSTLKAKKELESTGKPIVNGPIYDIAIKVLGIDILKKLNKTNPVKMGSSTESEQPPIKTEPEVAPAKQSSEPKSADKTDPKPAEGEKTKLGPRCRLKARKLGELTESGRGSEVASPAAAPASAPAAAPVVPVGFINRSGGPGSVRAGEPFAAPLAEPYAPSQREESILPDDDDVIAADPPSAPPAPKSMIRKNAKPLVLSSVLAATSAVSAQPQKREPIPKLVISAGKLMPLSQAPPAPPPVAPAVKPQTSNDATICLDSDEEDSQPLAPPTKKRPVALKSTAKAQKPKGLPVPVSITSSNPNPGNPNYVVIPSSSLNKLRPAVHNLQQPSSFSTHPINPVPQSYSSQSIISNPVPTAIHTSMGYMQPIFHDNLISHNDNFGAPVPTMLIRPPMTPMTQPSPLPQPLPPQQPVPILPKPAPAPAQNLVNPMTKTVCKPGDILRITATGQVEILNRNENPPAAQETPPAEIQETDRVRRLRERLDKSKMNTPPPTSDKPPKVPPKKSPERSRKISSSSSSSDDSTPEDPLSILKDVVHIKAPEDDSRNIDTPKILKPAASKPAPASKKLDTPKPSTVVGSTSISSKSGAKPSLLSNSGSSSAAANKFLRGTVTKSSTPAKTTDEVMKHISNTNTILKKLDKMMGASNKSIDTIDLDSYDQPSTSKQSTTKQGIRLKPHPQMKTIEIAKKDTAKKVVGTGKDIIISFSGKSPGLSTTNSGNKGIRVTNVEKIPAPTAKRAAPQPAPPPEKKKKTEPMTLKDFNIDDIDDIIELE